MGGGKGFIKFFRSSKNKSPFFKQERIFKKNEGKFFLVFPPPPPLIGGPQSPKLCPPFKIYLEKVFFKGTSF